MLLQLNPPLPVETPRGKAMAHVLIDYGAEYDLLWVCFQQADAQCWTWKNSDIRAESNITFGRETKKGIYFNGEKAFNPVRQSCLPQRKGKCRSNAKNVSERAR